jgi:flagellar M-ring protein FliF
MTVASNLPQGETAGGGTSSTNKNSTETVSYEINETRTEIEILPGEIEKISLAVLLNSQALGIDMTAPDAAALQEEMADEFRRLVASAAGIDATRGDVISVELMPFQPVATEELVEAPGLFEQLMDRYFWSALQALLLGIVVIVLGMGVVRPLLVQKPRQSLQEAEPALAAGAPEAETDPFAFLMDYASDRQDETAALLQRWLADEKSSDPMVSSSGPLEKRKVAVNE